jgi:hypothetical protein
VTVHVDRSTCGNFDCDRGPLEHLSKLPPSRYPSSADLSRRQFPGFEEMKGLALASVDYLGNFGCAPNWHVEVIFVGRPSVIHDFRSIKYVLRIHCAKNVTQGS